MALNVSDVPVAVVPAGVCHGWVVPRISSTVVEAGRLNAYALSPLLLSSSELVDRLVDDLEDFVRPVESIPVFPGEFFDYSVIFELSDQSVGCAVFDI